MRTRKEIEEEVEGEYDDNSRWYGPSGDGLTRIVLEVMLDIRDLLSRNTNDEQCSNCQGRGCAACGPCV